MNSLVIILIMSASLLKTYGDYLASVEDELVDIEYEDDVDDYDERLEVKHGQANTTEHLKKALKLFEETMNDFKRKFKIKAENQKFYNV